MIVDRWPIRRLILAVGSCLLALAVVLAVAAAAGSGDPGWLRRVLVVAALFGFAAALVTSVLGRQLGSRLQALSIGLAGLAPDDLSGRPRTGGGSEVAMLARNLSSVAGVLAEAFGALREIHTGIVGSTSQLEDATGSVRNSARTTSEMFGAIEQTAQVVSLNVNLIAAGTQELGTSIGEISRNANEAAHVATAAVASAESTTTTMNKLGDSSREIGDVVRLITSIAEQTNLLALNATIEAARAGDAGKGFAVVADEVKQLAQETARATEDISRRVQTIQEDANQAALSITEVAGVITRMSEFQTMIASAVEEQSATSHSINSGVSEAAQGTSEIAVKIAERASVAGTAAATMGRAMQSVADLARISRELDRMIKGFSSPTG